MRPHRKGTRGNTIVEASLTLTVFLVSVLSLADFGLSLFLHQSFAHQARAGARYGAVNPGDLNAIENMVLYNNTSGTGNGIMGLSPSSVSVVRKGTAGGPDDRIVVSITGYQFTWITPGYSGKKSGKPITITVPVEN